MSDADRARRAERLAACGSSDERIESLTGLSLLDILAVRAGLAAGRFRRPAPGLAGSDGRSGVRRHARPAT